MRIRTVSLFVAVSVAAAVLVLPPPPPAEAQRTPTADLTGLGAAGNIHPIAIWSDGVTMWVADRAVGTVYAYRLSDGARQTSSEFGLHSSNSHPNGIWSDGVTMWVADLSDDQVYAYRLSDGARQTSKEFGLHSSNTDPRGIWSDGVTIWVIDWSVEEVYAYRLSDGVTMWVADDDAEKVYAYRLSDGARLTAYELDLDSSKGHPVGIWSDGVTMWVAEDAVDDAGDRVYAYRLPWLSNTDFRFDVSGKEYSDGVPSSDRPAVGDTSVSVAGEDHIVQRVELEPNLSQVTVSVEPDHFAAEVSVSAVDADPVASGHQVALEGPLSAAGDVTVTVTSENGTTRTVRMLLSSLQCHDGLGFGRVAIDGGACVILDSIIVKVSSNCRVFGDLNCDVDYAAQQVAARAGWQVTWVLRGVRMVVARHVPDDLTLSELKAERNWFSAQPWAARAAIDGLVAEAGVDGPDDSIEDDGVGNGGGGEADADLAGELRGFPDSHDGSAAFTGELHFSENVSIGYAAVRDDVLDVTGGEVTKVRRLHPGSDDRNRRWELTIVPDGDNAVQIALRATTDCDAAGAVCTSGANKLTGTASTAITGPTAASTPVTSTPVTTTPVTIPAVVVLPALTAELTGAPDRHDGSTAFTVELSFSESFPISYRTMRSDVLDITGGEASSARRLHPGGDDRNRRWELTIDPDGDNAVQITLPAATDCETTGAICATDHRTLNSPVTLTIPGPT